MIHPWMWNNSRIKKRTDKKSAGWDEKIPTDTFLQEILLNFPVKALRAGFFLASIIYPENPE